jgi:predicted Fe-S protein YdhL (DUF1289 family)
MNAADRFPPGVPVPSPCIGICRLDDAGRTCSGCGRTLDEVAGWSGASDDFKRAVWRRIAEARESGDV